MSHHNYYLDLCAEAYIVERDAVLLRYHDKYDFWGTCGGHIDPGEDANEAAVREVWEETGLRVALVGPKGWEHQDDADNKDLVPPLFVNRHRINDTHEHSAFIFVATSTSRDIDPQVAREGGVECTWLTQSQLDKMYDRGEVRPCVYRYATAALARISEG